MLSILKGLLEGNDISEKLITIFSHLKTLYTKLFTLSAGKQKKKKKKNTNTQSKAIEDPAPAVEKHPMDPIAREAYSYIDGRGRNVDIENMSLLLTNLAQEEEKNFINIVDTLEQLKWTVLEAANANNDTCKHQLKEKLRPIWLENVNEAGVTVDTDNLFSLAADKLFLDEEESKFSQRFESFLLCNLLCCKSDRYSLSPLSGNTTPFVSMPMEALLMLLRRDKQFPDLVTDFTRLNIVSKSVEFLVKYICNVSSNRKLYRDLVNNKVELIPTIETDGTQIHLSFIKLECLKQNKNKKDQKKAKVAEISRWLAKEPNRSRDVDMVVASDDGVRFPVCVTAIDRSGRRQNYKVRKGFLYQYSTDYNAKVDYAKSDKVRDIENRLESRESLNLVKFKDEYLSTYMENQETLECFYGSKKMRRWRFNLQINQSRLFDQISQKLFQLAGVNQHSSRAGNHKILFVTGQKETSTDHKHHRPSRHAAFWEFFWRKAKALGVQVAGIYEYKSSQACMYCYHPIQQDPKKNHRAYHCENCGLHAHRDISSSELHSDIVWTEIIGYQTALDNSELPTFNPSDAQTVKYFRPKMFMPHWLLKQQSVSTNELGPAARGPSRLASEQSDERISWRNPANDYTMDSDWVIQENSK